MTDVLKYGSRFPLHLKILVGLLLGGVAGIASNVAPDYSETT